MNENRKIADVAQSVTQQLIAKGKITRGYIGATIESLTGDLADSWGLSGRKGAQVTDVIPGGPAQRAGLAPGDVVIAEPNGPRPIAVVKQIVGLIARRIICTAKVGDAVTRGERIGMIKFGSRTELYIPKWLEPAVRVQVGQTVRGTLDVIAVLGKPIAGPDAKPLDEEYERLAPRETPA